MYKSPIVIYSNIEMQMDGEIMKAVQSYGINVDKHELLRALQHDRGQYEKGYFDGKEEARPKWILASELLPAHGDDVLTYTKYKELLVAQWDCFAEKWITDTWDYAKNSITHWMPLPEAPKECE